MRLVQSISACALLFCSFFVSANQENDSNLYSGIGFMFANIDLTLKVDGDQYKTSINDNSLLGMIIGYRLTENTALEFRGFGNISKATFMDYEVSQDSYFGVFGKLIVPFSDYFEVYGLFGFGRHEVSIDSISDDDTDIAYGLGFQVKNHSPIALQIEWLKTYDENYSGYDSNLGYYVISTEETNIFMNLIYEFE
ncbi:outer membrane beta-barrel protein [Vibrio mimicus]|uniref:outer membrane beta-barrel protein n=1 Tax=Vibrio mimicus TaxID=674 RepID=UPI0006812575|nr:outer membrane beta-barrel protein [Vibrio mimicus]EJA3105163.1 outer membrane beta-barrel protein [Vibrio vulnificus]